MSAPKMTAPGFPGSALPVAADGNVPSIGGGAGADAGLAAAFGLEGLAALLAIDNELGGRIDMTNTPSAVSIDREGWGVINRDANRRATSIKANLFNEAEALKACNVEMPWPMPAIDAKGQVRSENSTTARASSGAGFSTISSSTARSTLGRETCRFRAW
jgi:hypothetical protein